MWGAFRQTGVSLHRLHCLIPTGQHGRGWGKNHYDMSSIEIRKVETKKELKQFVDFRYDL